MAFDCTSLEPAAHGHAAYGMQKSSKTASKEAQNGSQCPGNEGCEVVTSRSFCPDQSHIDLGLYVRDHKATLLYFTSAR
jgi:hypothetical protein